MYLKFWVMAGTQPWLEPLPNQLSTVGQGTGFEASSPELAEARSGSKSGGQLLWLLALG